MKIYQYQIISADSGRVINEGFVFSEQELYDLQNDFYMDTVEYREAEVDFPEKFQVVDEPLTTDNPYQNNFG